MVMIHVVMQCMINDTMILLHTPCCCDCSPFEDTNSPTQLCLKYDGDKLVDIRSNQCKPRLPSHPMQIIEPKLPIMLALQRGPPIHSCCSLDKLMALYRSSEATPSNGVNTMAIG
jgi:hypothetical protein